MRGCDIDLNEDTTLRVRRCWGSGDKEVVELSVEGGGDPLFTQVSTCLTIAQAFALAHHLLHEANVPMEVRR